MEDNRKPHNTKHSQPNENSHHQNQQQHDDWRKHGNTTHIDYAVATWTQNVIRTVDYTIDSSVEDVLIKKQSVFKR